MKVDFKKWIIQASLAYRFIAKLTNLKNKIKNSEKQENSSEKVMPQSSVEKRSAVILTADKMSALPTCN
ncbi:MAG: hypothetical protein ONB44_11445 [candidate division KSB1 bacterium]|nr:hypothetical protein [candidate division KSB1 bacterium]MDZ7302738.1 hypothetical protein [candidate division KSB1 bacterium]MDZ7310093.1 hypothetical protein [candidate division KSB1 bacterium]